MARRGTTNYLNNRDLLIEIHKSKTSYSEFDDPRYADFDQIIYDLAVLTDDEVCTEYFGEWDIKYKGNDKKEIQSRKLVNPKTVSEFIDDVKKNKVTKLKRNNPGDTTEVDDILTGDLVFRLMTYEHIPEDPNWPEDKPKKKVSDGYIKVNFPPFQHYIIENGIPKCVGLSHYKDGVFTPECGDITNKLGKMFMLLVEKISKKGNWRNYTYLDEMKSSALLQLSQVGLQFDEGRGQVPNPFAFYTTVVNNAFKRVLNTEKKNRDIRDDLIEMAGQNPSFSRQMEALDLSQTDNLTEPPKEAPVVKAKKKKGK